MTSPLLTQQMKQKLARLGMVNFLVGKKLLANLRNKWKLLELYQRAEVIRFLADSQLSPPKQERVFVAIAHIVSPQDVSDPEKRAPKLERLKNCIDALLNSFAHCQLEISITTLPGRNVVSYLPAYQRKLVHIQESPDWEPMYVGYRAQDEMIDRLPEFDWFLMIEDDIVIYDSLFLEKLKRFNRKSGSLQYVLFPNRYEMYEGKKSYIDLTVELDLAWDRVSMITDDGVKFAECSNPHTGLYCLSREQLAYWAASGRHWKNQSLVVGPLESAATFALLECFKLYKPHPQNLNYFEVRHYDTKYSKLFPDAPHHIISAVHQ
ncbi:MAG: hypothetical protein NW224_30405 [Leptolyngbyaceae cyanobacterium bins.302]|nr:hypothetical protein [Leptolyngbyaceae cyanobacterium bins.302]